MKRKRRVISQDIMSDIIWRKEVEDARRAEKHLRILTEIHRKKLGMAATKTEQSGK